MKFLTPGYLKGLSILCLVITFCGAVSEELPDAEVRVNRLSEQVRSVLEHYKSPHPMGLPGFPIPDPMMIPEIKNNIAWGTTLRLFNQSVHGLAKLNLESVYSNLADMEIFLALRVHHLEVLGNYSLSSLLSRAQGASNTTFTNVYAEGIAKLEVAKEGYLEATNIELDISVHDVDVYFENPGFLGSIMQGAMNSAGTLIIDAIKPYILREVNSRMVVDANKQLRGLKLTFPNSLSPLDVSIAEARKIVRKNGFDPYKMEDFTHTTGVMGIEVTKIWIYGISSFHRVGNITVEMENNTVYIGVSAGTQELQGKCQWDISMAGLINTFGTLNFSIAHIAWDVKVNQSLDTRKRPNLESLHINLGNFQLQFEGAGTLDYVIEAVVNILPNLLRNQIMLAMEEPLKIKIQEIFNEIDVEKEIYQQVQQFEKVSTGSNVTDVTEKPPHEEGLTVDESQLDDSIF